MITKQLILGLVFGISMSIISWIVGMIVNSMLVKTKYYSKLSNLNFIKSESVNESIGLKQFKWIVKNTFFKFFNQAIQIKSRSTDLEVLRHQMTLSEISHLIGFIFVTIVMIYQIFAVGPVFGLAIIVGNVILNLYPSLLQQENKRRIDRLIERQKL